VGDAGHVGQQAGQQAAGATFRRREDEAALAGLGEQPPRRFLEAVGEDRGEGFRVVQAAFLNCVGRGTGAVGGTQNSLLFYGLSIYNQAFRYFQLGYASAMAWVLLLIILATTIVLMGVSRRRVYYAGER
jgi:hypothetical protein